MIIHHGSSSVTLPPGDFWWSDELDYETVWQFEEEAVERGAVIVETFDLDLLPQRMTLSPTGPNSGWLPLSDWRILRTWSNLLDADFVVELDGTTSYTTFFARPAFKAQPVKGFSNRNPAEWWRGSINFIIKT